MRIALLPDAFVTSAEKHLSVRTQTRATTIAAGVFDPYFPLDPLATSPDGKYAWVRDHEGAATRVTIKGGTVERFAFGLRDAVYGPQGTVFAVLAGRDDPHIVEFDDRDPTNQREFACPTPQQIHWPYGPPYRFAAYQLDWAGALRLTATRWGVALAHVNGLLWTRFVEGPERFVDVAWRMPPVYQGWSCAYAHAEGLVVTNVHNGRTGDIVWLDRNGLWRDCFDSNWEPIGPCVPTRRGFVVGLGDTLVRYAGFPAFPCERVVIGGRIEDATVDLDARRVALCFGDRVALLEQHGVTAEVQVWQGDELDTTEFERHDEPGSDDPWHYEAIDDPDLGRVWKPDLARARALADELRGARDAIETLAILLPGPTPQPPYPPLYELALQRLRRFVPPAPTRALFLRVLERLAHNPPRDEYVAWALRSLLPTELRGLQPRAPVQAWLRAHIPALFEGLYGERRIVAAQIVADVHARPVWSLEIELAGGNQPEGSSGRLRLALHDFDVSCLSAPPSESSDEYAVVSATTASGKPVVVTVDPFAGGFAHRVVVSPPNSGDAVLRTAALFEPVVLESPDDVRVLGYGADTWPRLFIGRDAAGRLCASPFADDLQDARHVDPPTPLDSIRALLDALVEDGSLELAGEIDDALLWATEAAVLGSPRERAGQALEDLLVDHAAVDELFADPEQLQAAIEAHYRK